MRWGRELNKIKTTWWSSQIVGNDARVSVILRHQKKHIPQILQNPWPLILDRVRKTQNILFLHLKIAHSWSPKCVRDYLVMLYIQCYQVWRDPVRSSRGSCFDCFWWLFYALSKYCRGLFCRRGRLFCALFVSGDYPLWEAVVDAVWEGDCSERRLGVGCCSNVQYFPLWLTIIQGS